MRRSLVSKIEVSAKISRAFQQRSKYSLLIITQYTLQSIVNSSYRQRPLRQHYVPSLPADFASPTRLGSPAIVGDYLILCALGPIKVLEKSSVPVETSPVVQRTNFHLYLLEPSDRRARAE